MATSVCFQVVPGRAAQLFESLPAPARRVLRLCDGTRSSQRVCRESALPVEHAARILDRLLSLGAIARAAVRARNRRITPEAIRWIEGSQPMPGTETPIVAAPARVVAAIATVASSSHTGTVAFSPDEESFFSSSIDHLVGDEYAD